MKSCVAEYYTKLSKQIDIEFSFDGCLVQTVNSIEHQEKNNSEFGFLKVSIGFNLKDYGSLSDAPIFTRSKYLIILGLISFSIDEPIDVFNDHSNIYVKEDSQSFNKQKEKLIIEGSECSNYLTELIFKLSSMNIHGQNLLFSLFDRWRKARFMEEESTSNFIYTDEATLSYFHVLELLGDLYSKDLIRESKILTDTFTKQFNSEILSLNGQALENENNSKSKFLSSLLTKDISVGAKISYFLKQFNLYDNQIAFWVKTLIEGRNSVAHGRRVFADKSIFPVQPFFPLISDSIYPLEFLRTFTAKVISKHLGLEATLYDQNWDSFTYFLIQDDHVTKEFIKTESFKKIDNLTEKEKNILDGGLNRFVLVKKIHPKDCIRFYNFYLLTENKNTDFLYGNILAIIIIYETVTEQKMEETLKNAIIQTHKLECNIDLRFRDTMYFLDFHGFKTPKLEALIINNEIR